MKPEEARAQYPTHFADERVYEVVASAVNAGEAELYVSSDGFLMYDDPYFHDKTVAVRDLRYNAELGLHLSKEEK